MKLRQTCRVTEKFTSLTQSSWKWNASVDESAVFWRWMNEIDSFRSDLERHSLKTWRRVRRFLDLGAAEAGGRGQKIRTTLVQWQRNWFQMNRQRFHDWISFIRRPKGECIRPSHDDAVGWWGPYSLISADIQRMLQLCKDRIHFPLAKTDGNKRPSVPLVFCLSTESKELMYTTNDRFKWKDAASLKQPEECNNSCVYFRLCPTLCYCIQITLDRRS